MIRRLFDWMDDPSDQRGLRFAQGTTEWDFHSYADLARLAGGAAAQIESARGDAGRPVVLILPTGPGFVAAFFGALLAGDTPCPLPPPGPLQRHEDYEAHIAGILQVAQPSLVVTDPTLETVVCAAIAQSGLDVPRLHLDLVHGDVAPKPMAELGLLQFTSGSSGRPRGVRVTPDNLETNVAMISRWIGLRPEDHWASWLPLFHDMGLIGYMLMPVLGGVDLWLMRPDQFVRRPGRWLDCFGRGPAVVTATPPFGLAFARRHTSDEELEGCDFSNWRVCVAAAERLDAPTVSAFAEWLRPHGFDTGTLRPAYGLAENTLAVTSSDRSAMAPVVEIGCASFAVGERVDIVSRTTLDDARAIGTGAGWLVGSGTPYGPIDDKQAIGVEIRDEQGRPLPDEHIGEVHVSGPCVAQGYTGDERSGTARFERGGLSTGDAGFVVGGELYVIGRMGDSVKVRGRNVYMEDIEADLRDVPELPTKGRLVATAGSGVSGQVLCAVVEAPVGEWAEVVAERLRRACSGDFTVRVFSAPRGTILRTSSGKPRRRPMWQALAEGRLPVELAAELAPAQAVAAE